MSQSSIPSVTPFSIVGSVIGLGVGRLYGFVIFAEPWLVPLLTTIAGAVAPVAADRFWRWLHDRRVSEYRQRAEAAERAKDEAEERERRTAAELEAMRAKRAESANPEKNGEGW